MLIRNRSNFILQLAAQWQHLAFKKLQDLRGKVRVLTRYISEAARSGSFGGRRQIAMVGEEAVQSRRRGIWGCEDIILFNGSSRSGEVQLGYGY